MLAKCPQHQISNQDLIQYFVNGLRPNERQFVSAVCGESILNNQPSEAFKLLGDMAEESRDDSSTVVRTPHNAPATSSSNSEIGELCPTLKHMIEMMKPTMKKSVKACQLCYATTYMMDGCPTLVDDKEVNAFGHNNLTMEKTKDKR